MSEEDTGDTGDTGNWRDSLSDDLKTSGALADFKDVDSLAKSFVDLKSYQGNSIRIPGEDASDEARQEFTQKLTEKVPNLMLRPDFNNDEQSQEFFRTLGMPEDAEGYKLPELEVPEGIEYNPAGAEGFKSIAHKAGLTETQYQRIITELGNSDIAQTQEAIAAQQEAMKGLKQEWGQATEDRLKMAATIADKTGAPKEFAASLMGNPEGVKWLYSLAEQFGGEKSNIIDMGGNTNVRDTPGEAEAKISEMLNNREHPYWDSHHPDNQKAIKRMIELQKQAHPEAATNMDQQRA